MKILTKEEEEAHYNATLRGGLLGGSIGAAAGIAGVTLGSMRFPMIRHLTVPMKAFLVTSSATFVAITSADSASRKFEQARHPEEQYKDDAAKQRAALRESQSSSERITQWAKEHKYHIIGGSWAVSMGIALSIVSRSPLTVAQKLVQARVYAQAFTVAVLVATAAFEISDQRNDTGRYETIQTFDPNDPTHKKMIEKRVHKEEYQGEDQWKDMVASEEEKMKRKKEELKEYEAQHKKELHKKGKQHAQEKKQQHQEHKSEDKKEETKGEGKSEKKNSQDDKKFKDS